VASAGGGLSLSKPECDIVNHCAIAGSQAPRLVIPSCVMSTNDSLPDDVETLKQQLLARDAELAQAQAEAASAQAEVANVRAEVSSAEALITHLRLEIEKLKRDLFGPRNERKERLLDQMELQLEDLEAAAIEDEIAAAKAAATTPVRAFTRNKPARKPFPAHLPRERVVVPGPTTCSCCGSRRLAGSDRGGERAAVIYTLLQTARLNDVDPQAWLADVLARINDHNIQRLDQLSNGRISRKDRGHSSLCQRYPLRALVIGFQAPASLDRVYSHIASFTEMRHGRPLK
jgi:hypothetical protein